MRTLKTGQKQSYKIPIMKSPLEENPEILQKVGLFIALFNLIEDRLNYEFYFLFNQSDKNTRPSLDFLTSQIISSKVKLLKNFTGKDLCEEIEQINNFRNHISHGLYGKDFKGYISNTKRGKKGNYTTIALDEKVLDEYIARERAVLKKFHNSILKRIGKDEEA